jgi:hypothetical protein
VNGHDHTVTLEHHADQAIVHAVDNAYEAKYRTSPFLGTLLSNAARSTTSRLLPNK